MRQVHLAFRIPALVLVMLVAGLCGCDDHDFPNQPTAGFGQGVTLYPDSLFRGERVTVEGNVADFSKLRGPCNESDDNDPPTNYDDCVSSLQVPRGWTAVVFRDRDFRGASATYRSDVPDLDMVTGPCDPGFNDCISSMRVFKE